MQAMHALGADLWLLTEVHQDVRLPDQQMHVSTQRHIKPKQRWSGISSRWPISPLDCDHVGLALARVTTPGCPVLVACSVMPWRGAGTSWPGDPTAKHGLRFEESLHDHLHAIQRVREGSEPSRTR